MTALVGICFVITSILAGASWLLGKGIMLGVFENSRLNAFGQGLLVGLAIVWCVIGCIIILGTGA